MKCMAMVIDLMNCMHLIVRFAKAISNTLVIFCHIILSPSILLTDINKLLFMNGGLCMKW